MKQNTKQNIFFLALALVISVGIHYVGAWTGPTGTAPANDVSGLIDVTPINQIKGHTIPTTGILLDIDDPVSTTDTFASTNVAIWDFVLVDDDAFVESLTGPEFICADSNGMLILCP